MDVVGDAEWTQLPRPLYQLLTAGAHGQLLERLVLHVMKEASLMLELCRLLVDLEKPAHYRLSGLLLQVSSPVIISVVTTTEISPPPRWLANTEPTPPSWCFAVFLADFLGAVSSKKSKLPITSTEQQSSESSKCHVI